MTPTPKTIYSLGVLATTVLLLGLYIFKPTREQSVEFQSAKKESSPIGLPAPLFTLIDQNNTQRTLQDLKGTFWIADFIFTRCPDICPMLTSQLAMVRADLQNDIENIHYVSFSVDPNYDTPPRLLAYANARGANHSNWFFLTGSENMIYDQVAVGFKQGIERIREEPPVNILHGSHFILVNKAGMIHGYYRSDEEGIEQLKVTVKKLSSATQRQ